MDELEQVSGLDSDTTPNTIVEVREQFQYDTKLSLEDDTYDNILYLAKTILLRTKLILEESQ